MLVLHQETEDFETKEIYPKTANHCTSSPYLLKSIFIIKIWIVLRVISINILCDFCSFQWFVYMAKVYIYQFNYKFTANI